MHRPPLQHFQTKFQNQQALYCNHLCPTVRYLQKCTTFPYNAMCLTFGQLFSRDYLGFETFLIVIVGLIIVRNLYFTASKETVFPNELELTINTLLTKK